MNLRYPLFFVLALGALFAGGCATPAQPTAMAATPMGNVTRNSGSVSLNVTGGSETTAAGASQISNDDFAAALRQSIENSGLFAEFAEGDQRGDYHLEVNIVRLEQPLMGFSMTATLEASWTLVRQSDQEVVWRKAVVGRHTAAMGEAFAGVTRLRLATEGAARENIRNAISQMSALSLQ